MNSLIMIQRFELLKGCLKLGVYGLSEIESLLEVYWTLRVQKVSSI
ncbi:hypothetical protein MUO71_05395 [Candidatus Bathyarchaeota archaeon]|nr:hypothetical protein [Candidatus Bathyarchaeota archaeon]